MVIVPHAPAEMRELSYRGSATVGAVGRARLHARDGGIGEMRWEALDEAGWIGERVSLQTIVSLRVRVRRAQRSEDRMRSRFETLSGARRTLVEATGLIDEEGMARQWSEGPLDGRAAGPGYRLLDSERRDEDLEFGEDLLYTAAVRAGWVSVESDKTVAVPDVHVVVGVSRFRPNLAV